MLDYVENNKKENLDITIFCINLNNRFDRWINIKNEYHKFCKKIVRIPAINHKNNIKACGLSFLKCIYYAKSLQLETILICEDDVTFHKNSKQIWLQALTQLPDNWDILLGGLSYYNQPINLSKKDININIIKVADFSGEHMILIRKKCYDKLMEYLNESNNVHFDRYLGNLAKNQQLNIYCTYPFTSKPILKGYSDIRNEIINDTLLFKLSQEKIKNTLEKFKNISI